jgi:hypothetical protein
MTQGESVAINGTGAQTGGLARWGDYSSLAIDPVDGCTFWNTNEYIKSSGSFNWSTRITSFKLPLCPATPPPDFSLSVAPTSQTVTQGASTTYTVNITRTGGFTGAVNLSLSGLGSGASGTFSPNPTTGASSTLTVTTTASAATGSFPLMITGTSGSLTHMTSATLVVTAATAPNVATFDDLFPTERFLNGQYPTGQIDWGTNQWWLSGPWGLFTTNSISLPSASVTSASFTFLVPRILLSVDIYNGGTTSSTVTISCAGNPTRTQLLAAGQVMTLSTGWTTACSPVTLGSSNGWDTNFDNVTYRGTP